MKIIQIGTDRKIFEENSAVRKRVVEYGKLFEELHIIIFSHQTPIGSCKIAENVWVYSTNSKNKLFYVWDAFKIVRKILATNVSRLAFKNYVVSCQDPFETGLVGFLSKLFFGVSLQLQIHTDFKNKHFIFHSTLNFIRFIIAHFTLPVANSIRCVSAKIASDIREMNGSISILPISQIIYLSDTNTKKEFNGKILTISRLEKEKNLEMAIKVFAKIYQKYPQATFTIVGEGSQRNNLEKLVKNLKIEKNVNFVGWQNSPSDFYKDCDIYLSTSLFEGYGMSIVEVASYGLPLVLSNTGIAREYFENNGALIFEPKDFETAYTHLNSLFENPDLRDDLSKKAIVSVRKKLQNWDDYLLSYKNNIEKSYEPINSTFIQRFFSFVFLVVNRNKIIRFVLAGGGVAVSQILILFLLTDFGRLWYLFSSIVSYVYAVIASFLLQKYWVFRDNSKDRALSQFSQFVFVALIGIIINTSSMYFWVEIVSLWYVASQFITGIMIAVINFFIYKFIIFKK